MTTLKIDLLKIRENIETALTLCHQCNLDLAVVTKCCGADNTIIRHVIDSGVCSIAESHPFNYRYIESEVGRIGLQVSISSLDEDIPCDTIYISDFIALKKLAKSSFANKYKIVIPIETGDMREGVPPDELSEFMKKAFAVKKLRIVGFSSNYCCLNHTPPSLEKLDWFVEYIQHISKDFIYTPHIISIGGSSLWSLMVRNEIPDNINQIRMGESIFLGLDPATKTNIDTLHQGAFVLEGEILEIRDKRIPQNYENTIRPENLDSNMGSKSSRLRKRAVLDFGYTTCQISGLVPEQTGVNIVGSSQDLTVIDVTDTQTCFKAGDFVRFFLKYEALSMAMINPYIKKCYVGS